MGSPLSPIITNLSLEENVTLTATVKPSLWIHYVDNTFVTWPREDEELGNFHYYYKSLSPSIQFTTEKEEQMPGIISGCPSHPRGRSSIHHNVLQAYPHKLEYPIYMYSTSNHHPKVLAGVMKCMRNRAHRISDNEENRQHK